MSPEECTALLFAALQRSLRHGHTAVVDAVLVVWVRERSVIS